MNHRIVVFGTGVSAEKALKAIRAENKIVAYLDNNYNKHGLGYKGAIIYNPQDIQKLDFDYIVIAIIKYKEVVEQLAQLGVDRMAILPYFDINIVEKDSFEDIFKTQIFLRDNYELKYSKLAAKIDNMEYEVKGDDEAPEIKSVNDTIDVILNKNVSISRYGDGEFKLILGRDLGFQKYNLKLVNRLKEILKNKQSNHIVGLLNVYEDLSMYTDDAKEYFRDYLQYCPRKFQYSLLDRGRTYYDSFITRPYICYRNRANAQDTFSKMKQIWDNRKVLIVEGDRTRLGRGNDLFNNVKECRRILCPAENAFDVYDDILKEVKRIDTGYLVLIALGPTATVLAYDLAQSGYQAIDIGHIDIEYEWYRMGASKKVAVVNKYTNEAHGGNRNDNYVDEEYEAQVLVRIK